MFVSKHQFISLLLVLMITKLILLDAESVTASESLKMLDKEIASVVSSAAVQEVSILGLVDAYVAERQAVRDDSIAEVSLKARFTLAVALDQLWQLEPTNQKLVTLQVAANVARLLDAQSAFDQGNGIGHALQDVKAVFWARYVMPYIAMPAVFQSAAFTEPAPGRLVLQRFALSEDKAIVGLELFADDVQRRLFWKSFELPSKPVISDGFITTWRSYVLTPLADAKLLLLVDPTEMSPLARKTLIERLTLTSQSSVAVLISDEAARKRCTAHTDVEVDGDSLTTSTEEVDRDHSGRVFSTDSSEGLTVVERESSGTTQDDGAEASVTLSSSEEPGASSPKESCPSPSEILGAEKDVVLLDPLRAVEVRRWPTRGFANEVEAWLQIVGGYAAHWP